MGRRRALKAFESSHWSEDSYVRNVNAEAAGKGIEVLSLDIGGDIGGRSVLRMAEGGNRGPRELRVGIQGSSHRSPRKRRMWILRRLRTWGQRSSGKKGLRGVMLQAIGPRVLQ